MVWLLDLLLAKFLSFKEDLHNLKMCQALADFELNHSV